MIEIHPNLFLGIDKECSFTPPDDWAIIHACKKSLPCKSSKL